MHDRLDASETAFMPNSSPPGSEKIAARSGRPRHLASTITTVVLALLGLAMLGGGAWLLRLGGSWYYLIAGAALLLTAWFLHRREPAALWLYAALLVGTTAWAVWEVRLDWWQLVPRLWVWFVIGLWLLTPWARGALPARSDTVLRSRAGPLVLALLLAVVVGGSALTREPHDLSGELALAATPAAMAASGVTAAGNWTAYGGDADGTRYSALAQITPENLPRLQVAWQFETGDKPGPGDPTETTDENTPLKIGELLYLCTPHSKVIALDATTGAVRWRFDPHITSPVGFKHFEHMTCRGVSYHDDAAPASATTASVAPVAAAASAASAPVAIHASGSPCARRLFLPTADARLIALDADSGQPCTGFGDKGTVNLRTHIGEFKPGGYYATSPPVITHDLVIIGGHVSDNGSNDEPSGVIRAYDVHDGHLVWNLDAGRPDVTTPIGPGQTYTRNSPNMWSVASVDEKLGLLYLPMGNQTPDQWGGERTPESERLSAGVVALDVASGHLRWVHQFTHHDLWDMDVGGQPSLVDLQTPDGTVPALVASTKQGSIYVLDRRTGRAIVQTDEVPVPQGAAKGDHTAPTQPVSRLNFNPPVVREADMWGGTPLDQLWCRIKFRSLRYEGMFTPPSLQGSLVFPGNFGVFDWGGVSVDPVNQVMIVNPNYMAFTSRLIPKSEQSSEESKGEAGLKQVGGIPFDFELNPFLSPLGIPCQAPPWGYIAGVDLKTHRIAWMHKNGTIRDSAPLPIPLPMGVPSLGGTIVTAGGVAFLSGTLDQYIRGYDVRTGRELWKARLPAGGQSTPMTYADRNGRQIVLVTAGGHGSLGTKPGDAVIAYALPG
jgi:quinoprotein glucose dehydrogenase